MKMCRPELKPVPLPDSPWQKLAIDIKGPTTIPEARYLIVIVDYYSKWPEVIPVSSISSESITNTLREVFQRYGFPKEIVSDNGKQFVAKATRDYLQSVGVQSRFVALYAPSQNGLVERFNRTLSEKFKECERFGWKKIDAMSKLLFDYRGTPHSTTGVSPFEAMFGRKMRNDVSRLHPRLERSQRRG